MLKQTHRAFGFAASATVLLLVREQFPIYQSGTILEEGSQILVTQAAAVFASTLPDIDQMLGLRHRGLTHAIWFPAILLYFAWQYQTRFLLGPLLFGLFLGYFFHLLGDAFSKAGIAWLYPIQRYRDFGGSGDGAFCVKGFRGPFIPLYSVGDSAFCFMPVVWWILGAVSTVFLWMDLV